MRGDRQRRTNTGPGGLLAGGRSSLDPEVRVPGDLPEEAVRIGEISRMPAPGRIFGGRHDRGAGCLGLCQHLLDLLASTHVVGDRESPEAVAIVRNRGISGQLRSGEQPKPRSAGLEKAIEGDSSRRGSPSPSR